MITRQYNRNEADSILRDPNSGHDARQRALSALTALGEPTDCRAYRRAAQLRAEQANYLRECEDDGTCPDCGGLIGADCYGGGCDCED